MQDQLKKALEFSNYQHTFSIQKKILKEKCESKLTFGFNGGIFYIDTNLLTFVEMLCNNNRTTGIVLLDSNKNPIIIDDLMFFKDEIFSRYFEVLNEYFEEHQKLIKSRSVEKIVGI